MVGEPRLYQLVVGLAGDKTIEGSPTYPLSQCLACCDRSDEAGRDVETPIGGDVQSVSRHTSLRSLCCLLGRSGKPNRAITVPERTLSGAFDEEVVVLS